MPFLNLISHSVNRRGWAVTWVVVACSWSLQAQQPSSTAPTEKKPEGEAESGSSSVKVSAGLHRLQGVGDVQRVNLKAGKTQFSFIVPGPYRIGSGTAGGVVAMQPREEDDGARVKVSVLEGLVAPKLKKKKEEEKGNGGAGSGPAAVTEAPLNLLIEEDAEEPEKKWDMEGMKKMVRTRTLSQVPGAKIVAEGFGRIGGKEGPWIRYSVPRKSSLGERAYLPYDTGIVEFSISAPEQAFGAHRQQIHMLKLSFVTASGGQKLVAPDLKNLF